MGGGAASEMAAHDVECWHAGEGDGDEEREDESAEEEDDSREEKGAGSHGEWSGAVDIMLEWCTIYI